MSEHRRQTHSQPPIIDRYAAWSDSVPPKRSTKLHLLLSDSQRLHALRVKQHTPFAFDLIRGSLVVVLALALIVSVVMNGINYRQNTLLQTDLQALRAQFEAYMPSIPATANVARAVENTTPYAASDRQQNSWVAMGLTDQYATMTYLAEQGVPVRELRMTETEGVEVFGETQFHHVVKAWQAVQSYPRACSLSDPTCNAQQIPGYIPTTSELRPDTFNMTSPCQVTAITVWLPCGHQGITDTECATLDCCYNYELSQCYRLILNPKLNTTSIFMPRLPTDGDLGPDQIGVTYPAITSNGSVLLQNGANMILRENSDLLIETAPSEFDTIRAMSIKLDFILLYLDIQPNDTNNPLLLYVTGLQQRLDLTPLNSLQTTGSLTVAGQMVAQNSLSVVGQLTAIGAGITTNGALTATSGITTSGSVTALAGITTNGTLTATSGITTSGAISALSGITTNGTLTAAVGVTTAQLTSTTASFANVSITGWITTSGALSATYLTASGALTGASMRIFGAVTTGAANVTSLTASGAATAASLSVAGAITARTLSTSAPITTSGTVSAAGALTALSLNSNAGAGTGVPHLQFNAVTPQTNQSTTLWAMHMSGPLNSGTSGRMDNGDLILLSYDNYGVFNSSITLHRDGVLVDLNNLNVNGALTANAIVGGLVSTPGLSTWGGVTAGAMWTGPITASWLTASSALTSASLSVTGAMTAGPISATAISASFISTSGAHTGASMSVSGGLTTATLSASAAVTTGSVSSAGSLTSTSITTGAITASTVTASGALTSASVSSNGGITTHSSFVSTQNYQPSGAIHFAMAPTPPWSSQPRDAWAFVLVNNYTSSPGNNTGQDFAIFRYGDDESFLSPVPFGIQRRSGQVEIGTSLSTTAITANSLSASGAITAASLSISTITANSLSVSGAVTAASFSTSGAVTAGLDGITTSGIVTSTGYMYSGGQISAATNLNAGYLVYGASYITTAGTMLAGGGVSSGGTVSAAALSTVNSITTTSVFAAGSLSAQNSVTATSFIGAGLSSWGVLTSAGVTTGPLTASSLSSVGAMTIGSISTAGTITSGTVQTGTLRSSVATSSTIYFAALGVLPQTGSGFQIRAGPSNDGTDPSCTGGNSYAIFQGLGAFSTTDCSSCSTLSSPCALQMLWTVCLPALSEFPRPRLACVPLPSYGTFPP